MKPPDENIIELEGLKKSFGSSSILKGVNLAVRKGETIVVLGKIGDTAVHNRID